VQVGFIFKINLSPSLEDIGEDWRLLLKEIIKNRMGGHKVGSSASG
jgi:hypothetical protein